MSAPATSDEQVKLWSVTTLIKLGLGTSDALVNWAVRTTAEYAVDHRAGWAPLATSDHDAAVRVLTEARWTKSGKAAARGTDVHRAAEQLALGAVPEIDDITRPYVEQYVRFLETHQPEFVMAEAPVYALDESYAGTSDGVMRLGGRQLIFDIKTTDKPLDARSRPPYPEVALQLVAYAHASEVGVLAEQRMAGGKRYYVYNADSTHEPMPEIEGAVAIVVSPYDCRVLPIRIDAEVHRAFRHVKENARWQLDISRRVIGPEITAAAA